MYIFGFFINVVVFVILVIVINAILALIPARVAKSKGYSFIGFWILSFFITWLFGLIICICLSNRNVRTFVIPASSTRDSGQNTGDYNYVADEYKYLKLVCPNCGYRMGGRTTKCEACGWLDSIYAVHTHPYAD